MKSLTIVGDLHFSATTPRSRTDDFAETCIEKLSAILEICKTKGYKHVVQLGDFFNTPQQPLWFMNQVIDVLQEFQKANIQLYAIYGNHSLISNDVENGYKSGLGLLFKTGYVKELRNEVLDTPFGYSVGVHGYHYPEGIQMRNLLDTQGDINICVMHRYFEKKLFKNYLTRDQLEHLNYDIYASGHDHMPYDLFEHGNYKLLRPGRIMRGTSDNYNLEDNTVFIDTIVFQEDKKTTVVRDIVPTKLASQVFTIMAQNKDSSAKYLSNLSNRVADLLDMMDENTPTTNNLYVVLDRLPIDIRIKDRVEKYLKNNGIYREDLQDVKTTK